MVEFGKSKKRPRGIYSTENDSIKKKIKEKDLGVFMMDNLSPEKHINNFTAKT